MNKKEFIEKYKLQSAKGYGNAQFDRSEEMERDLDNLSDLPESKGSETDMGTKIEPEFPSWTETESGVTEKSNPQYGIYHFLKHWYYRVVAPCLKSDGWIPEIREAVADYMFSEGCSCCRDINAHIEHEKRLGELLFVDPYSDGSGYDFSKYRSNK